MSDIQKTIKDIDIALRIAKIKLKDALFIIKNYPEYTDKEIADSLSLHRTSVTTFRLSLGLQKKENDILYNKKQSDVLLKKLKDAVASGIINDENWKKYLYDISTIEKVDKEIKKENIIDDKEVVISDIYKESIKIKDEEDIEKDILDYSVELKDKKIDDIKQIVEKENNVVDNVNKETDIIRKTKEYIDVDEQKDKRQSILFESNDMFKKYKKELEKIIKDKDIIKELEKNNVLDKILIMRPMYLLEDWKIFIYFFLQYLEIYKQRIDMLYDFSDLISIVKESYLQDKIIKQISIKEKETEGMLPNNLLKQYNDSVNRLQKLKNNLEKRIKDREDESATDLIKKSFAELVLLFDNKESKKALAQIDREEYDEMLDIIEKIKKRAIQRNPDGNFDGNEEGLLLGMDEQKLDEILQKTEKILLSESVKDIEKVVKE